MQQSANDSGLIVEALRASGEVGNDLLAVDWTETPLGPPESWPSSLSTVVRVILSSRFAMWMAWGPKLTFFCNDAYRRDTLGTKYPWALGRPASEVWAEIWTEIGPRIERVLHTGEATWDESLLLFLERSGYEEETYHTFSYSPLADDDGVTVGMLCVVSEETERVIGERRLTTLRDLRSVPTSAEDERAFLEASAAQLAGNPRSLPFVVIYAFDADGKARLAATTGANPGEPVAPELIEPGSADQPWPADEMARGETDWILVDDLEKRFGRVPSGAWPTPPFQAVVVPLPGAAGAVPVGFMVVGVNHYRVVDDVYRGFVGLIAQRLGAGVTSARSYAAERSRAEQLAELDRAKSAFFSNVSHEFRTPLTLMLAPLQDALQGEVPLAGEQVELVHRNGLRLLKLVNALLDFSRLEAGRLQAAFRPVDVAGLTSELVGTFRDACERAGLRLDFSCDEFQGTAYVDPDLWERVVLNLVSNAFKVTLDGGISVHVHATDEKLSLSVADTGPGIPAMELDRIFERFHRVRGAQARSNEGAGIGLSLVREIVQLHGGQINVTSVVGEGSEFIVEIPLGREHLPDEHVSEQPPETTSEITDLFGQEALSWLPHEPDMPVIASPKSGVQPGRVLIVDDNPDLRRYLTRLLSPFWEVDVAGDGLRALEIIRDRPPDLLVTDVMMPNLDGFGLLRELRSSPQTQDLPVVMLSARAGEEAAIEGLEAGADDYLPKPFSGRELLARVRAHLDLSLVRRQASDEIRAERLLLEQIVNQLPVGVLVAEAPSGRILIANEQIATIFGEPSMATDQISGRLHMPDRKTPAGSLAPLERAVRGGEVVEDEELEFRSDGGRWITIRANAAPVIDGAGHTIAGVVVLEDISDRMRNERLLSIQRDIMAMIAEAEPLETILAELVKAVERLSSAGGIASILMVSADRRHLHRIVAPGLPAAYNTAIDGIAIGEGMGSCGTAAHRREPVVVTAIRTDPLWSEFRDLAAEHNLQACWSVPIFATDQLLVGTFAVYHHQPAEPDEEDRKVVELLSRTAGVAIQRARDAEHRARQLSELQTSLLPPVLPAIPGLEAAASFRSGDRSLDVGGDFYDVFALADDTWGFVIGDVCGHGAQAAAVTALTRHSTWSHARSESDPGRVLAKVSEALSARGYGRYCTAVYGRLRKEGARVRMTIAVGGHPPPLVRRADGTVEVMHEHGPLLGVIDEPRFPVVETLLEPGDALVLYTDGLVERNPRLRDEDDLSRIVAGLTAASADELLAGLEEAALGPGPRDHRDDIAILIARLPT